MIYYENNNGTRMDLDNWPVVIEDITELYGKEWKYSATENVNANRKKLDKFYRTGMSKKNNIASIRGYKRRILRCNGPAERNNRYRHH